MTNTRRFLRCLPNLPPKSRQDGKISPLDGKTGPEEKNRHKGVNVEASQNIETAKKGYEAWMVRAMSKRP